MTSKTLSWAVLLVAAGAASAAAAPESLELRIATQAPQGSAWWRALERVRDGLLQQTRQQVRLTLLSTDVVTTAPDVEAELVRRMKQGTLQGALLNGMGIGAILPEFRILETPFLFRDAEEFDRVRRALEPRFVEKLKSEGFAFVGWSGVGEVYLFSREPLHSLDELKNRRVWMHPGDDFVREVYEHFKVESVHEIAPRLVKRSLRSPDGVTAFYNSPFAASALEWEGYVGYMSKLRLGHGTGGLVLAVEALQDLSDRQRDFIKTVCRRELDALLEEVREQNGVTRAINDATGALRVIPYQEGEEKTLRELGEDLARKWTETRGGQELWDQLQAARRPPADPRRGE